VYPLTSSIKLISDFGINGGDEKRTGYYAGLIVNLFALSYVLAFNKNRQVSLFFLAEASMVFQWSRLSDSIGRKPVLAMGLTGVSISMICFGLSRTFGALVLRSVEVCQHTC
jgi:MFS family permease